VKLWSICEIEAGSQKRKKKLFGYKKKKKRKEGVGSERERISESNTCLRRIERTEAAGSALARAETCASSRVTHLTMD